MNTPLICHYFLRKTLVGSCDSFGPPVLYKSTCHSLQHYFSHTSLGEKYPAFQLLNASLCSASTHYVKMMKHSSELIGTAVSIHDHPKPF